MFEACRLCLSTILNEDPYDINITSEEEIKYFLPEIDTTLTSPLILCHLCLKSFNNSCVFKQKCLRVEHTIQEYLQRYPNKVKPIDLTEIKRACFDNCKDEKLDDGVELINTIKEPTDGDGGCYLINEYNLKKNAEELEHLYTDTAKDNSDSENHIEAFCNDIRFENSKIVYSKLSSEAFEEHIIFDKYSCEDCKRTFKSARGLKQHISSHLKNKSNNTEFHKGIHSEESNFVCILCEKRYKKKEYLKRHIAVRHRGIRKHTCDICGKKFGTKCSLLNHIKIHTGERLYKCEYCAKRFITKGGLDAHIKCNHREEKPFLCETCGKGFKLQAFLKAHIKVHMEDVDKKFVCPQCNKRFYYNTDLKKHMLRHSGVNRHNCQICKKGFIGLYALKRHVQTHTGEKPYKCDICYHKFTQKCSLDVHLKKHKTNNGIEKPFLRETCGEGFKLEASLKTHIKVHTGNVEKKYVCTQCNKKFYYNKNLQKHISKHIGEKTHNCQFCNKGFTDLLAFKQHVRIHTGEKHYKCDICFKEFRQKLGLQGHLKTHNATASS